MKIDRQKSRVAFSLMELVAVMAILMVLAAIAVMELGTVQEKAEAVSTKTTLGTIRDAINGTTGNSAGGLTAGRGYRQDMKTFSSTQPTSTEATASAAILSLPQTLASLYTAPIGATLYSPVTELGWHGPYISVDTGTYEIKNSTGFTSTYGNTGDTAPLDGWRRTIVIQIPSDPTYARLVSAGPDGIIQTPPTVLDPPLSARGDDIVLFLLRPDQPAAQ